MKIKLHFNLTESQKDVVDEALGRVKSETGWKNEEHALEGVALDYCAGPRQARKVSSNAGKRERRTISVYADQLEVVHEAFNAARELTGCSDDSAAFVEICEAFLDEKQFGGSTAPGSGPGGPQQGESPQTHDEENEGCDQLSTLASSSSPYSIAHRTAMLADPKSDARPISRATGGSFFSQGVCALPRQSGSLFTRGGLVRPACAMQEI